MFPLTISRNSTSSRPEFVWVAASDERHFVFYLGDKSQAWFWTEEWQAMEREADEDLRLGRYEDFDTMEDFINSL